jgi:hypothetical protein
MSPAEKALVMASATLGVEFKTPTISVPVSKSGQNRPMMMPWLYQLDDSA